ncbi:Uncharacterised protein [Serratia fonticola]|nr:Uncharacterised protein [Serratia fonticola]
MKPLVPLCFITLLVATGSHAVLHPGLVSPKISSCKRGGQGACSDEVWYTAAGTQLVDIAEVGKPHPDGGLRLSFIGLHCRYGSALTGKRFRECTFNKEGWHSPTLHAACSLKSIDSWELANPSTCSAVNLSWGPHSGAGPGGECVLVVQDTRAGIAWSPASAYTIYGLLSPDVVANSGSTFCQKPLPPNVLCDIALPQTLDHGEINTNSHSVVSVYGNVDCGGQPKLTIMGGGKLHLGPGLSTVVTAQMDGASRVRLTSTLDAINAESGEHSGAVVVLVSPY